jgi:hypothetical protein
MLEAALFSRKLASPFWYFVFCIPFNIGNGFKSDSGTGKHSGSGSAKAKSW